MQSEGRRLWGFTLRGRNNWLVFLAVCLFMGGTLTISNSGAATTGIALTRHNLSKSGQAVGNNVYATTEDQICAFCHTPHNATISGAAPLWNRKANVQTYTRYTSASLDANNIADGYKDQPGGSSLLCLSCHDGTVALGDVGVLPKSSRVGSATTIATTGSTYMPTGLGVNTGFTRVIGTDLTNDHPISITYNKTLADTDLELATMNASPQRDTKTGTRIGVRTSGSTPPLLPLEPTSTGGLGQVQCATCHDPHVNKSKFLRLNRFQTTASPVNTDPGGAFDSTNDQICLACHRKPAWAASAHADSNIADEAYNDAAATLREFPLGTKVWQAGCLNCHDTHTVQGSRRLLREGVNGLDTDFLTSGGASYRPGVAPNPVNGTDGNNVSSAIENTCFQCHRDALDAQRVLNSATGTGTVPPVKTLFELTYGMPIRSSDQASVPAVETHNVTNGDLIESQANLGRNNTSNRHAECPDCHNPHRIQRNSKFNNVGGDTTKRTHQLASTASVTALENNVVSGALRGGWGVQPVFIGGQSAMQMKTWPQNPDSFTVKKGDPGILTSTAISSSYLTREYQLCFKCHSNYANGDTPASFPDIGYAAAVRGTSRRGTTLTFSNGMKKYTNVAAEFSSVNAGDPDATGGYALSGTDQGESTLVGTACNGADCVPIGSTIDGTTTQTVNHRSWHPVMFPTGRDRVERGMSAYPASANIRPPFDVNVGKQTMQCNDCHGQGSSWIPGTGPDATQPQGPHGSSYPFLLRGDWSLSTTKIGSLTNQVCGYCHQPGNSTSGFGTKHNGGGQGAMDNAPCMFCHIAVPHGWRNKAFLANMNCVGTESGLAGVGNCTAVMNSAPTIIGASSAYSASYLPPYYNGAKIRINTWARSGNWQQSSCTGSMTSCGSGY